MLLLALTACSDDPSQALDPSPARGPGTTPAEPDSAPPVADDDLDAAALTDLLRTRASARGGADACGPTGVEITLVGFDMAAGHRYSRISVRNTSAEPCVVEGVPGIGVRGARGSTFVPEVRPGTGIDGRGSEPARPVELGPGESATSDLEWSGELAGAESERASLVVLQLAAGQTPVAVPARIVGTPEDPLDIGERTTISLTPFVRR